jgi:hypothetical protein
MPSTIRKQKTLFDGLTAPPNRLETKNLHVILSAGNPFALERIAGVEGPLLQADWRLQGSFDCVDASLREPSTPLKMTETMGVITTSPKAAPNPTAQGFLDKLYSAINV